MDTIKKNAEFAKALKVVRETIAGDKYLRMDYVADIANAFCAAYKKDGGRRYKTLKEISNIAAEAADNFLTQWCK